MKTRTLNLFIAQIRRDGGTQIRAALDESTVADYAALIKDVSQYNLPSVTVYFDGADHWLSDGFHRIEAALRAGAVRTPCEVRNGTQRDAILAACGANAEHGLRRSHADKRNAVNTLLDDPEWSTWSDRKIAKQAAVDHGLVAKMREERRAATSEKLRPVAAGGVALTPLAKGSPARALGSPQGPDDGEEGAVVVGPRPSHNRADSTTQAGAADAPSIDLGPSAAEEAWFAAEREKAAPSIDLLGLDDIDPAWLELTDDVCAALDAFDNHMRQAQGALSDLLSSPVGAQLQALQQAAHDLGARARKSVRPKSCCLYCKDPDGTQGRRDRCNGCRELGWLTEEQLGAVPRELTAKGEAAKVIDVERGGYVARAGKAEAPGKYEIEISPPMKRAPTLRVELVDEAGASTSFEEETDSDGEPAW